MGPGIKHVRDCGFSDNRAPTPQLAAGRDEVCSLQEVARFLCADRVLYCAVSFFEFVNFCTGILQKDVIMSTKPKRQVLGIVVKVTRAIGLILIVLAILGLPQMRFLTGSLATSFGLIMSVALGLAGVAWLFGVQVFLHFFDQYLSRN
jgi:hypothetical protein